MAKKTNESSASASCRSVGKNELLGNSVVDDLLRNLSGGLSKSWPWSLLSMFGFGGLFGYAFTREFLPEREGK